MISFSDSHIAVAGAADITAVKELLNNAYRGETSRQGWTTEAGLISGNTRTSNEMLLDVMQLPGSVILVYRQINQISGCVNLQQHGKRIYLGMFAVLPQLQGEGIGKKILQAAEEYALHVNAGSIYMSVISVRTELIDWYKRHGYVDTGERKPFTEDGITGKHLQPLEFMMMEKTLY